MLSRFISFFYRNTEAYICFLFNVSVMSSPIKRKHIELAEIFDLLNSLFIPKIKFNTKFM